MDKERYKKFEHEALGWIKRLENYNEGPFKKKISETEWSMGELYQHLFVSTLYYHIKNCRDCIAKQNGKIGGNKTFKGILSSTFGSYQVGKLRPEINKKHPPEQPESISVAKDRLIKLLKEMEKLNYEVNKLTKEDLKYKIQHPFLGYLNAKEWYDDVEMHFRHHLKQREKIERTLVIH